MKKAPPILVIWYPIGNQNKCAISVRRELIFDVIGEGMDRLVSIRNVGSKRELAIEVKAHVTRLLQKCQRDPDLNQNKFSSDEFVLLSRYQKL